MLYEVLMKTSYSYGSAAVGGRHVLRLMPAEIAGVQRMIVGSVDIVPQPQERHDQADFFGNRTIGLVFAEAHDEIAISMRARVERLAVPPGLDVSPRLDGLRAEIAAVRSLAPGSPHHFAGVSPRVSPDPAVGVYARRLAYRDRSVLAIVTEVNRTIHADMRYDAGATTVETPMAVAFAARHGVCQDFSHVMIACLREIGIPAAYVSGYLRTEPPKGQPRLEGADAMHAWVAAWCGIETGWVEFDPTNALRVSCDHIVVARGRDYSDVAPVKGVLRTAGTQTASQSVDVIPLG